MSEAFFWDTDKEKEDQKSLSEKAIELCSGIVVGFTFLVLLGLSYGCDTSIHEINKLKKKLRLFKPTVHYGIFGKYTSWELRDKPLTDEEVEKLWNSK